MPLDNNKSLCILLTMAISTMAFLIRNKDNCPPGKGTTTTISIIISLS